MINIQKIIYESLILLFNEYLKYIPQDDKKKKIPVRKKSPR